ncbi:MAG: hypothetical protein M1823_004937 [Watsoniomyces obsoletus]|nr:MAG: hypothetical protein M1823_004937 [Watsoniomyces obsoletus]
MLLFPWLTLRHLIWTFFFIPVLASCSTDGHSWTPIVVKNITQLGQQISPPLTNVSRDGGHSVLLDGHLVWLYADTECFSANGKQLSFISNTAAYADELKPNLSTITDFGIVTVGKNYYGDEEKAILHKEVVGGGGWIPFTKDELVFNERNKGEQRIAIWPGSSPAAINRTHALFYAPIVYVDSKPEDPAAHYSARGMTLLSMTAPVDGPEAARTSALLFPGDEVPFGGFAALVGSPSTDTIIYRHESDRDVYLLGVTDAGLQLARVPLQLADEYPAYTYFQPRESKFVLEAPDIDTIDREDIYLEGSFTSGGVFFSPYFKTFILIYFNKFVDSTFYIRFLDLDKPLHRSKIWSRNGKRGKGIEHEDVEALVFYPWSPEQVLYRSPPDEGGFNYLGAAHPEYFNRQYYPRSDHFRSGKTGGHPDRGEWYGGDVVPEESAGGDGKHLLLSWTSQHRGGLGTGIYEIHLAMVEFDEIPERPSETTSTASSTSTSSPTTTRTAGEPTATSQAGQASRPPKAISPIAAILRMDPKTAWSLVALVQLTVVAGIVITLVVFL